MSMQLWRQWLNRLSRQGRNSTRNLARRRTSRPCLEALEDRWVPATITRIHDIGTAFAQADLSNPTIGGHLNLPVAANVAAGHYVMVAFAIYDNQPIVLPSVSDSEGN